MSASVQQQKDFISKIAPYVVKHTAEFGIKVNSPIIAQACLESGYGTSTSALGICKADYNNFFGLKYRPNRVTCSCGIFKDGSYEQRADGQYYPVYDDWFAFKDAEQGVLGYLQFINISKYANLKGVTDPYKYLTLLRQDGYCTSLKYVNNVFNLLKKQDLTQYDIDYKSATATQNEKSSESASTTKKYYRVNLASCKNKANADDFAERAKAKGFDCIVKYIDGYYKAQCGAFATKANAQKLQKDLKAKGFNSFIAFN